jgi:hypothetical protein
MKVQASSREKASHASGTRIMIAPGAAINI